MTPKIDLSNYVEPLLTQLEQQGLEPIDKKAEHILYEMDGNRLYVEHLFREGLISFNEYPKIIKRMHRKISKLIKSKEKKRNDG